MSKNKTLSSFADLASEMGLAIKECPLNIIITPFRRTNAVYRSKHEFKTAEAAINYLKTDLDRPFVEREIIYSVTAYHGDEIVMEEDVHPSIEVYFQTHCNMLQTIEALDQDSEGQLFVQYTIVRQKQNEYGVHGRVSRYEKLKYKLLIPFEPAAHGVERAFWTLFHNRDRTLALSDLRITDWQDNVLFTAEDIESGTYAAYIMQKNRERLQYVPQEVPEKVKSYIDRIFEDTAAWARENMAGFTRNKIDYVMWFGDQKQVLNIMPIGLEKRYINAIKNKIFYRLQRNLQKRFPEITEFCVKLEAGSELTLETGFSSRYNISKTWVDHIVASDNSNYILTVVKPTK